MLNKRTYRKSVCFTVRFSNHSQRSRRADTKTSHPPTVLDLPQLYTRPSAPILLSTLDDLKIKPSSWAGSQDQVSTEGQVGPVRVNEDGVPKYLTGIISSSLLWIEDEDARERVYEAASARLAERAGRTGERIDLLDIACSPFWSSPLVMR